MEFLANFGLNILVGMFVSCIMIEASMTYLSGNDRWRIPLTTKECIITITSIFVLAFLGGHVGVTIQNGFAHASSNLSLVIGEYTPPETFAAMALEGEANALATAFAFLFSLPYAHINSYWVSKRQSLYWKLKDDMHTAALKYGKNDVDYILIKERFERIKTVLYKDVNGYCP